MKKPCDDNTPNWFVGHWRDWHRGHGCAQDDGKDHSEAAAVEIEQHKRNEATGYLTDADLHFLRASTTAENTLLVRALDELAARRSNFRAFVSHRLAELVARPEMWARRKEAFVAQIRLLVEIAADSWNPSLFNQTTFPGESVLHLDEDFDPAWARDVIDRVRRTFFAKDADEDPTRTFDHSDRRAKHFDRRLGFCACEHCAKLPEWESPRC